MEMSGFAYNHLTKKNGSPRHSTEISSPQATQVVKYFTKQTPQLCQRSICGYNRITFASTQMVCWQILQLLLEISLVHPKDMHHEKTPMGFKCSIHVFCNKFGDLALFISFTRDSSNDSFFALRDTDTAYSWGGRAGSQVWYSPHHLRTTSVLWSYTMMFPCNIQKKHGNSSFARIHIQAAKKTTYKGKCMIHGVQTYHKSVLMCMQFMAK